MAITARTPLFVGIGLGVLGLIAAGCGSSGGKSVTATASISGNHVTVIETEFHLAFPQTSFSPGSYTFTAVDAGKTSHALTITGPGVNATTKTLSPGGSASITVSLQAGSYDVFCPIDSHKSLGMNQEISVGTSGSASGAASGATTPATTGATTPATTGATTPATTATSSTPTTAKASSGGYGY